MKIQIKNSHYFDDLVDGLGEKYDEDDNEEVDDFEEKTKIKIINNLFYML